MKQGYLFFKTIFVVLLSLLISLTGKAQTTLAIGDISIIGFNSNGTDNFAFVNWVPITNNTYIKFTDNGFLGAASANLAGNARGGENFVIWQNNTGNTIDAGTVIRIEGINTTLGVASAGSASGLNGLAAGGDQIFAYQGTATSGANPDFSNNNTPTTFNGTLLYGLNFQGSSTITTWLTTSTATANTSYLPTQLNVANGNIALGASTSFGEYGGGRNNQVNLSDFKAQVNNPANWLRGSGSTGVIILNTTNFTAATNPVVNLSVSSNTGTEAGTTVITVTATTSSAVSGPQTVDLAITGTGITTGDYSLSAPSFSFANGTTTASVTFTVVDDIQGEGPETAILTLNNASPGIVIGSTGFQNIAITDNDPLPIVTLSVSTNTASETNATTVTVTATASALVSSNPTVTLAITGAGITASDYVLSSTTITIASGQTSGSVTFKIRNDAEQEGIEIAVLTISNPSSSIILGTPVTQNVSIDDNVCQALIRKSTATSAIGAEISVFDASSSRVFTVAGTVMEYYTLSNTGILSAPINMPIGFTSAGNTILPNSVDVRNGVVAVSYAIVNTASQAQQPGVVAFYNASTATYISQVSVGFLPDMLIFSPDGTKIFTANEGEPNSYGQGNSFDPEGSVSIINIAAGLASATVNTIGFTSFNSQLASLKAAGVRIYGPGATVAQDLEPEYIAFSADGNTAFVTLQENNAVAELNITTATFTQILPLGLKNHSLAGNGFDASDQDGGIINIATRPVFGMYQPDAIAGFSVGGNNYFITANEGDSRAYTGYSEEVRVADASYVLDPTVFSNAASLKQSSNLGRLQLTNATGDTDNDGDIDQIQALGARSFSIWSPSFTQIFDSGDQLEQITAAQNPRGFNSDGTGTVANFDTRSDNKGAEPEAVTTGIVNGILYAFIGSERTGDVFVYDITNPAAPVFKQYLDNPQDLQVEGVLFVSAAESPTGKALIITSAEASRTVTVYEFSLIANALATVNTIATATQGTVTAFGDCAGLVAQTAQNGVSPIAGTVTAKVFIQPTVPSNNSVPYVQRHYEITVAANSSTSTGRVTLYFTQAEFDNFNADPNSTLDLPTSGADAAGKANLIVIKYPGTSSDGSGLPATYTLSPSIINPNDAAIIFNAAAARWEISFDVTGFSGFFVQTSSTVLPVTLLSFTGKAAGNNTALVWKVNNEINHAGYDVQFSKDGRNFATAGSRSATNITGDKTYNFIHENAAFINEKLYYRLKINSTSGAFIYSDIIIVRFGKTEKLITDLYPTPTTGIVHIVSNANIAKPITINIFDISGRKLTSTVLTNSSNNTIDITNYVKGIYLLEASVNGESKQQFKIVKQ